MMQSKILIITSNLIFYRIPFYKITVPCKDIVRYSYLIAALVQAKHPTMIVGEVGTAKTSTAKVVLNSLNPEEFSVLSMNMSANLTASNVQDSIESKIEKRTKTLYVPPAGKVMVTFMDDFNLPAKDIFGSQPPLELIRQWIDYGFWYDRATQNKTTVKGMTLLTAMGPPGGGRNHISSRLISKFSVLNITFPSDKQLSQIFGTLLSQHFKSHSRLIADIVGGLTRMTIVLFKEVANKLLPTPTKTHYLFNLRDISKVFQGLLRTKAQKTRDEILLLWFHECLRTYYDRLIDDMDKTWFVEELNFKLDTFFGITTQDLCPDGEFPIFCNFLNQTGDYEQVTSMSDLKDALRASINQHSSVSMEAILFKDFVEYICSTARILSQPKGHALLIGIGGGGRKWICQIASFICNYSLFSIELNRLYRLGEFKEDLKRLYLMTGIKDVPSTFLFSDNQVVEESFLVIVNNILSTAEVNNLYKPEEFEEIKRMLHDLAVQSGIIPSSEGIYNFLLERVKCNLHMAMYMSPVGDQFRARIRQYPNLIGCSTMIWLADWPQQALLEVAAISLEDVDINVQIDEGVKIDEEMNDDYKKGIAAIFANIHTSVKEMSKRVLLEMKKHNYITPVNYLELVQGYKNMLESKRYNLALQANKLRNGLSKLADTREKILELEIELTEKNKILNEASAEYDRVLEALNKKKKELNESEKEINEYTSRVVKEQFEANRLAGIALADLEETLPAVREALQALEALNKQDVAEVRSYGKPPQKVEMVLEAVMILKQTKTTWAEAKRQLGDVNFLISLRDFDKDNLPDKVLKKLKTYTHKKEFDPEVIGGVSVAAKSLAQWVKAIEMYADAYRIAEPKRKLAESMWERARKTMKKLQECDARFEALNKLLLELQQEFDEQQQKRNMLLDQTAIMKAKLERAGWLVDGLAGEKERWEQTVESLHKRFISLPGDCVLAVAFLAYLGPFLSNYRDELVAFWSKEISDKLIPVSNDFNFKTFLTTQTTTHTWIKQGLPNESFSLENAIIISSSTKWPLVIDPQSQAWKWIKNSHSSLGLSIVDFGVKDYMKVIETAMSKGEPVLLQNVTESIEANVLPILSRNIVHIDGRECMMVGDKMWDYNPDFKFFITTKLNNPHFPPEISTRTTVVNFAIKREGLQSQLLGLLISKEKPRLELEKAKLVTDIAQSKQALEEMENELLKLLAVPSGSLLEDEALYRTLQKSQVTAGLLNERLKISLKNEASTDASRQDYDPSAKRAAILFFVLKDLALIDPMYQFSLDSYINLFLHSIQKSKPSALLIERIKFLNDFHTEAVFRNTCRGLFEKHKLLFAFLITVRIQEDAGSIPKDYFKFLLQGGVVLHKDRPENPVKEWLSEDRWDNVTELAKLTGFEGFSNSFVMLSKAWREWYFSSEPENQHLPGQWEKSNDFMKLLIIRSVRLDRLLISISKYVKDIIGQTFIEPPVFDIRQIYEVSEAAIPMIFVLSPGVDPASSLQQLANDLEMSKKYKMLSLGQGQSPIAQKLIEEGIKNGTWLFLANCHLSLSWMPRLDKIIEELQSVEINKNFRLWLSSSPHPDFPISILQTSLKMTTEPPKGIRSNMMRLYNTVSEAQYTLCDAANKFQRLLFGLVFFHSVLLERKKFLQLGWNVVYNFNDSDFAVSHKILSIYLDEYPRTPWEALKYLIAGVFYGGHVTDEWDRRLLMTYIDEYYVEALLSDGNYRMCDSEAYMVPPQMNLPSIRDHIANLPLRDSTEFFGLHSNADVVSLDTVAREFCETLMVLQVQGTAEDTTKEVTVMNLSNEILAKLPALLAQKEGRTKPLDVILSQEITKYNNLLEDIRESLINLQKSIKGLAVMSSELEDIFSSIYEGRVPQIWLKAYPSLLRLGAWSRNLTSRLEFFATWEHVGEPLEFWLGAFTFPSGFLTAVLQKTARKNQVSIDTLEWDFKAQPTRPTTHPANGVYINHMYLEGAGWNRSQSVLQEPNVMELIYSLPTFLFVPTQHIKRNERDLYHTPVYYYPVRGGTQTRASYIVTVKLKSGMYPVKFWIKRGVAILLNLSS